jgi:(p)ppGpp synthase/HD superfamily hydrolase
MSRDIVYNASQIAREAHKGVFRKWSKTNDPYVRHCERCADKAKQLGYDEVEQAAMWVHDVFEDVAIPTNSVEYWEGRIRDECGQAVVDRCWELTNTSDTKEWMEKNPDPSRVQKWTANLAHIRVISDKAKRDKMIDRNDNVNDMEHAPYRMKRKYVPESRELLAACRYTDEILGDELEKAIDALEKSCK